MEVYSQVFMFSIEKSDPFYCWFLSPALLCRLVYSAVHVFPIIGQGSWGILSRWSVDWKLTHSLLCPTPVLPSPLRLVLHKSLQLISPII